MKALPFNFRSIRQLSWPVGAVLFILPLAGLLAACLPLAAADSAIRAAFNLPMSGDPSRFEGGTLYLIAFLPAAFCLALSGYLFGWACNAVASRYLLPWTWTQVRAFYLLGIVPQQWQQDHVEPQASVDELLGHRWSLARKLGLTRFIVVRGLLFGSLLFFLLRLLPSLMLSTPVDVLNISIQLLIWLVIGVALAGLDWLLLRRAVRRRQ
jgi:hypothetical protein